MPLVDLVMPKMGESIMEATILKWHKQPGDSVKQDETVLEIATDKVDTEVPSVTEGVLEELLFQVNDVVPIGTVIARIRTAATSAASADGGQSWAPADSTAIVQASHPTSEGNKPAAIPQKQNQPAAAYPNFTRSTNDTAHNGARFYSPLVLNIAANEGVPLSELESIPGSGNEGRVTKKDILQYISDRQSGSQPQPAVTHTPVTTAVTTRTPDPVSVRTLTTPERTLTTPEQAPMTVYSGNVEIVEMDRMRRLIADHMVRSVHTSPHVTSISEADVTHLVHWREKVKKEFEKERIQSSHSLRSLSKPSSVV